MKKEIKKTNKENKNDYVLITGATGGLGRAFCKELAENYNLLLSGTSIEKLKSLQSELQERYTDCIVDIFACDLSSIDSRVELLDYIDSKKMKISLLINNAGYITEGSIQHSDIETLLKCIEVNCEGTIHITKALLDRKKTEDLMRIITITSMASNYPMPYMAIYSSTKSLLKNFMIALREEYKRQNVKVLIVEPGAIATSKDMIEAIKAQGFKGRLSSTPPSKIAKYSIRKSLKNKKRYIPGFFNKLTVFVSNLAPTGLKIKAISGMWRKSQEKRNIK